MPAKVSFHPNVQYAAIALSFFLTLLGSHLATPLYAIWQTEFGLTTTEVSLIFACYPSGVTAGLLFGGRLADQLGRKPLVVTGIVLTVVSCLFYLAAANLYYLVAARLLNGIAIGLMSGPAVATIVELQPNGDRVEGSRLGAITTLASPAAGLLVAVLIADGAPSNAIAVTLPFLFHLACLAAALALVMAFAETLPTASRRSLAQTSFYPQGLRLPKGNRGILLFASAAGAFAWANTGLWLALGPTFIQAVIGPGSRLAGGLMVVAFLGTAGLVQLFARGMRATAAVDLGLVLLPVSLAVIFVTLVWNSAPLLLFGALAAGAGQGLVWLGCSALVNGTTASAVRASVLSVFYIAGYFGTAIPVVTIGVLADHLGLLSTASILAIGGMLVSIALIAVNRVARPAE